jgi:hypothetical protein
MLPCQLLFLTGFSPSNSEDPGTRQGLRPSSIQVALIAFGYSFNEFGSDVFFGDFRLR